MAGLVPAIHVLLCQGNEGVDGRPQAGPWMPRQLRLLRRIASRASLTLLHAVTATVDTTPGALWDPSSPNRLATITMPFEEGHKH